MSDDMPPENETETEQQDDSVLAKAADAVSSAAGTVAEAASGAVGTVVDAVKDVVTSDDEADETRSARKVREGTVVSNKMDKTAVVAVVTRVPHAKYNKMILQTTKLYAHDEANDAGVGDRVRVMETRPMSKNKRWRLVEIVERAR